MPTEPRTQVLVEGKEDCPHVLSWELCADNVLRCVLCTLVLKHAEDLEWGELVESVAADSLFVKSPTQVT